MRTFRALSVVPVFLLTADSFELCRPGPQPVATLSEVSRVFIRSDSFDYEAGPQLQQLGLSVETAGGSRTSNGNCLDTSNIDVRFAGRAFPFVEDGGSFYDPLCGGSGFGCFSCRSPRAEQTLAARPLAEATLSMQERTTRRTASIVGLDVDRAIRFPGGQTTLRAPGTLRFDFDDAGIGPDPFVQAVASNGATVRAELVPGAILVHVDAAPTGPLPLYVSVDYALAVTHSDFAEARALGFSVWERQAAVQISP